MVAGRFHCIDKRFGMRPAVIQTVHCHAISTAGVVVYVLPKQILPMSRANAVHLDEI